MFACITAVILVLSVEPGQRVEAIKALPPVIRAIRKSAIRVITESWPGGHLPQRPSRPAPITQPRSVAVGRKYYGDRS